VKKHIFLFGLGLQTLTSFVVGQKPNASVGTIDFIPAFSSHYVDARSIAIWLPRDYSPHKKHKVIYLHDGQNLFDANITWNQQEWNIDEHLQQLIDNHQIEPCIAVGIWNNGAKRHVEYFPQKPFESLEKQYQDSLIQEAKRNPETPMFAGKINSDAYLLFIAKELIPYVQNHYSVSRKAKDCIIAGASMGGLISWYAALEYPKHFGNAACFSTHWPGIWPQDDPHQKIFRSFLRYAKIKKSKKTHWYFDHGTEGLDQFYDTYQKTIDALYADHPYFKSQVFQGFDHSEKAWSHHFEQAIIHLWK
jgi:enterochelin esterase-like enzyme